MFAKSQQLECDKDTDYDEDGDKIADCSDEEKGDHDSGDGSQMSASELDMATEWTEAAECLHLEGIHSDSDSDDDAETKDLIAKKRKLEDEKRQLQDMKERKRKMREQRKQQLRADVEVLENEVAVLNLNNTDVRLNGAQQRR